VLQAAHAVERLDVAVRHLNRRMVIGGDDGGQIAEPLGHDVEHRVVRVEGDVLHQARHLDAGVAPHRAGVGRELAAHDLHEGGLAGAVPADERQALAGLDLQRDVVEQRQVAVGVGDVVERDERHGGDRGGAAIPLAYQLGV
jgi:hypothetical protein